MYVYIYNYHHLPRTLKKHRLINNLFMGIDRDPSHKFMKVN